MGRTPFTRGILRDENRHVDREIVLRTLGEINETGWRRGCHEAPGALQCVFSQQFLSREFRHTLERAEQRRSLSPFFAFWDLPTAAEPC